jgi:hypothetical protein
MWRMLVVSALCAACSKDAEQPPEVRHRDVWFAGLRLNYPDDGVVVRSPANSYMTGRATLRIHDVTTYIHWFFLDTTKNVVEPTKFKDSFYTTLTDCDGRGFQLSSKGTNAKEVHAALVATIECEPELGARNDVSSEVLVLSLKGFARIPRRGGEPAVDYVGKRGRVAVYTYPRIALAPSLDLEKEVTLNLVSEGAKNVRATPIADALATEAGDLELAYEQAGETYRSFATMKACATVDAYAVTVVTAPHDGVLRELLSAIKAAPCVRMIERVDRAPLETLDVGASSEFKWTHLEQTSPLGPTAKYVASESFGPEDDATLCIAYAPGPSKQRAFDPSIEAQRCMGITPVAVPLRNVPGSTEQSFTVDGPDGKLFGLAAVRRCKELDVHAYAMILAGSEQRAYRALTVFKAARCLDELR